MSMRKQTLNETEAAQTIIEEQEIEYTEDAAETPEEGAEDTIPEATEEDAVQTPEEDSAPAPEDDAAEVTEEDAQPPQKDHWWRPKNEKVTWLLYVVAVALVALGGFAFFYASARQEPVNALKEYLGSIQSFDLDAIQDQLLSSDFSGLDTADITTSAYADFFRDVNSRMEYTLPKTSYSLTQGTARVKAHLRYVDGTQIYESVVAQFLRDIVSSAFSGNMPTQEETEEKLAALLNETASSLPEQYAETEITYPLTKTEEGWKIDAMDEQTVKVMSANFRNIEEELDKALAQAVAQPEDGDEESPAEETSSDRGVVSLAANDALSYDHETYGVQFSDYKVAKDYADQDCVLYYFTYTNHGDVASSAIVDVNLVAFQNGETLSEAIPNENDPALDALYAEVAPGESLLVCKAFSLKELSNVSIQADGPDGEVMNQVLRIP